MAAGRYRRGGGAMRRGATVAGRLAWRASRGRRGRSYLRRAWRAGMFARGVLGSSPFGPFGAFGPFGPFSPLRRRGAWKYIVAAAVTRAAVRQAARGFGGKRRTRSGWRTMVPWAATLESALMGERAGHDRARTEPPTPIQNTRAAHRRRRLERAFEEEKAMPHFGFGEHERGGPGRRSGRGDVKYVLLDLLREGPRHGYDMIKELERRSGGMYTPSPGSVYPTLQMLEDQGLVLSTTVEGKRTYRLTDAGYAFVEERSERTDDARGRAWVDRDTVREEARTIGREAGDLARSLRDAVRSYTPDTRQINEIRDVIGETRKRIEAILAERREQQARDDDHHPPTVV